MISFHIHPILLFKKPHQVNWLSMRIGSGWYKRRERLDCIIYGVECVITSNRTLQKIPVRFGLPKWQGNNNMGSKSKSVGDNISTGMVCFNRAYNNRACSAAAAHLSFYIFSRHLYFVTHAIRQSGDRRCSKALQENRKLFAFDYIWAAAICKVMRLWLDSIHGHHDRITIASRSNCEVLVVYTIVVYQ